MRLRPGTFFVALLVGTGALADPAAPPPEPAAPRLLERVHAATGFIDDPLALSDDGTRLAYVTTDGATHAELHLRPVVGSPADPVDRSWKHGSVTPERIEFLDGARVLVVDRDPASGQRTGAVYGPKGPAKERLGPATDIALGVVDGVPAIVSYTRAPQGQGQGQGQGKPAGGGATHTLIALRRDTLRPLARKVLVEDAEGKLALAGARGKPLYFLGGYTVLVVEKEGGYDKAKDVRRPALEARVEVFSGKALAEKEIPEVVSWTRLVDERRRRPNRSAFVRYAEDLTRLLLVDEGDREAELVPARPLKKYDPTTLSEQPSAAGGLTVSLTVDPVNPDAVKAQKADPDVLELYHLDVAGRALSLLARLDGEKRPSAWRLAGRRLALLRKHKGFGRGGADLELYELAAAGGAAKAGDAAATQHPSASGGVDGGAGKDPAVQQSPRPAAHP